MDALADCAVAELTRTEDPPAPAPVEAAPVAAKKRGTSAAPASSGSKSAKVPKKQLTPEEKVIQATKRRDRRARAKESKQGILEAQRLAAAYALHATGTTIHGYPRSSS